MLTAANKFDKIGSNILKKFSNMEISFYIQIVCSQATSTLNVKKKKIISEEGNQLCQRDGWKRYKARVVH